MAGDALARDAGVFGQVLKGFREGGAGEAQKVTAPAAPDSVTITGAGGRPLRLVGWGYVEQQWFLREGQVVLGGVPPGRWQVRTTAPDGKAWEATVTTAAGSPARVVVR